MNGKRIQRLRARWSRNKQTRDTRGRGSSKGEDGGWGRVRGTRISGLGGRREVGKRWV